MELKNLIAECTAYDYKEALEEKKPKSWLKSVSAFANTLGGSLFFGVDNDGNVKGLVDIQHVGETISMKIRDYMDPLPNVDMIPQEVEGEKILQLKVLKGKFTPYYYVGDGQRVAFVRNGTDSLPATDEEMKRLVLSGANRTYDSLKSDVLTKNSTFVILANTFEERTGQKFQKKFLKSFGLLTEDGYLTNAGVLFSDDCNQSQSRLYCTKWNGLEKDDALNDAEFKGNILMLLREAMAFTKANTRKGWEKLPDGRKNKPEYAERAVLEAVVNHLIHRDYTVMGGEVHLDIYDDRVVLTSPGGMYSGQKVQDLTLDEISSERRNPVLADVMAQLDLMEKRGSGLKRICNETKELETYKEGRDPLFKSSSSQFMTIIYSMEYEPVDTSKHTSRIQVGTKSGLSRDQVVTKLLPSSYQVVAKLSLSIPMIRELLQKMVDPMPAKDMREFCGQKGATYFKANVIDPLIAEGLVAMTHQDTPNSPNQKYYLTDLGKAVLDNDSLKQAAGVSEERIKRLIDEFAEALPQFPIGLPSMENQYKATLPVEDVRCFYVPYLMKKEMFRNDGAWVYNTPELYLTEIQANIWQRYNVQFLMHQTDASYRIRFSEIKKAFEALGVDGRYAVITSFYLGTFDLLYGGDVTLKETDYGYLYGDMPIYRVPSHEARMIVMRKELLPRYEAKVFEGDDKRFKLINEQHLLYSNIFNMEEKAEGLGLIMMRDLKFYYPSDNDFHYVKLVVDRMERVESELDKIKNL
jgi:ATP-dependent DNA helicase RecG